MGRPELSWRNVINHVFGPLAAREKTPASPPTSPAKSIKHLRPSKSFLTFRSPPSPPPLPSREFKDDTSSFMSPMPRELCSHSSDESDMSSSISDELEDWDDTGDADPARQSFMECSGILNFFPEPPITVQPRTLPSRRRARGRFFASPLFLKSTSNESISNSDFHKKRMLYRSPTPLLYSIRHGPVQYSTTSIPFDLLSRSHRLAHSDSAKNSPVLERNSSLSSTTSFGSSTVMSYRSTLSPTLARSRSCNLLSRSRTPEPSSTNPLSKSPLSRRLSTSLSLQNLRSTSHTEYQSSKSPAVAPSPPSSFQLAKTHVPGLELRVSRSSRGSVSSFDGGSHVPIGTPWF
ncbi:hypothetical protein D9756_007733 [Leucocoprinus leucothites]|uniref:Uncharacterized protein n=1 Tax=Leucocoprinus leucothites TaxID=201217 RepID=A0A8H5D136_9AGAR|nr:hypothetical protein D9756_007733 [Leucoagaricus leucothites]